MPYVKMTGNLQQGIKHKSDDK